VRHCWLGTKISAGTNLVFLKKTRLRGQCYDNLGGIGRIFAFWAIVYFGKFLGSCKSSPHFYQLVFHGKVLRYFGKKGLGGILGDFFHDLIWSP
jgi:hypothetical protein